MSSFLLAAFPCMPLIYSTGIFLIHCIEGACTVLQYANANAQYKNIDKLIHYANRDGRLNLFYSTPARYVAAKHSYRQRWPLKTDDFFPYADCPHCYWTGTSWLLNQTLEPMCVKP